LGTVGSIETTALNLSFAERPRQGSAKAEQVSEQKNVEAVAVGILTANVAQNIAKQIEACISRIGSGLPQVSLLV
jgi:hypothetical protein